jgi:UDP-N-acetylmuramate--alanine ligase
MFLLEDKNVSGSDMSDSKIIEELRSAGAKIKIGHSEKNLPKELDLVIYTIAITDENPELKEAKRRGIKCITYPQALHEISKEKYTIAVSGTHGKTTTTAMIAKMMIDAGLDPTVIVGSLLKSDKIPEVSPQGAKRGEVSPREFFQTNFIAGKSRYLVVEACEYRRSFLNIEPDIAVITNIDNDHLDYYKDIKDIQKAFGEFTEKVPEKGYIVCDEKDKLVIQSIKVMKGKTVFSNQFTGNLKLKIPGEHNIKNAQKALAVANILKISPSTSLRALNEFNGTWRRFEFKGETSCGALVYDDYGHHPTEIKATLKGAREFFSAKGGSAYGGGDKKIVAVFQPHLFSRTKLLLNDFAQSFKDADEIILAPIYPAREAFDPTISSNILAEKIREHKCPSYQNNHPALTKAGKGTSASPSLIKEEIDSEISSYS